MNLPSGSEELPTEEVANIPVLKDKDVDPGSLDGCDRILIIDMLPNQILKHIVQHTEGGVYVGEGLPPILQKVTKRIVKGDSGNGGVCFWNCGLPPIKRVTGRSRKVGI